MECNKPKDIVEVSDTVNTQSDCGRVRGDTGRRDRDCKRDGILGDRGIDSSLLFFFLLLVAIVCNGDCDIELDTLLFFFLLLVILYD
ncbi:MAG TPA: hypothetical protein GX396_01620 [Tissierellia bacterium]|nr:hypothetical protein [Tissierellia bacterium]